MDVDLKTLNIDVLKTFCQQNLTALFDLQCGATPDLAKMKKYQDMVKKLSTEIKEREEKVIETKPKDTGSEENSNSGAQHVANRDFTSHKIKNMSSTISSEVPVFSSGHDVHIWLTKLDSYHKLFVAPDSTGVMEEHFLQVAKSRLCSEYLNAMMASSEDTSTYAGMKGYMKKHHASKVSVFQILDTIWDMDKTDSETLRDYGIRLDDKAAEAKSIIEAKFKEYATKDVSRNEKDMQVEDVFRLMSGQVFLQALKNKKQTIYNNVCNDLDSTWSAAEIANKAMTFADRMSSENSQNQAEVPKAFSAKAENKQSNASRKVTLNCRMFLRRGHCKHGKQCRFLHDEEAHKVFKELKSSNNDDSANKSNSGKSSNPNQRNQKGGGNNQPQSAAVHSNSAPMPMLPLPTQDFRI